MLTLSQLKHKARVFLKAEGFSRQSFLFAFVLLWQARYALKRSARKAIRSYQLIPVKAKSKESPEELCYAVRLASRYVPKSTCLVQALAAKKLLAGRGYDARLSIGVSLNPFADSQETNAQEISLQEAIPQEIQADTNEFKAHAWLEFEGKVILGWVDNFTEYTTLEPKPSLVAA